MNSSPDWALLSRYLAGECDEREAADVERWLAADVTHAELLAELREIWDASVTVAPSYDVSAALRRAHSRRRSALAGEAATSAAATPTHRHVPLRALARDASPGARARAWIWRAAAVLLVAASGTYLWRHDVGARNDTASAPVAMREVATTKGQRANVYLSDGTRVILGVDSRIRYAAIADASSRDVFLEGQAYFEVTHDEARPFRVHTNGAIAEDLGTEFVVRAYPGDSSVTVVVASGKVKLSPGRTDSTGRTAPDSAHDGAILDPDDMGQVGADGRVAVSHGANVTNYLAWTRGQIRFDAVPLSRVLRELGRWYDLQIELADPRLASIPVTATFDNQPAREVMRDLAGMLDMRLRETGTKVTLTPR